MRQGHVATRRGRGWKKVKTAGEVWRMKCLHTDTQHLRKTTQYVCRGFSSCTSRSGYTHLLLSVSTLRSKLCAALIVCAGTARATLLPPHQPCQQLAAWIPPLPKTRATPTCGCTHLLLSVSTPCSRLCAALIVCASTGRAMLTTKEPLVASRLRTSAIRFALCAVLSRKAPWNRSWFTITCNEITKTPHMQHYGSSMLCAGHEQSKTS